MSKIYPLIAFICLSCLSFSVYSQIPVEGYVYETGNRGYLYGVKVLIMDGSEALAEAFTDNDGYFSTSVPSPGNYTIHISKDFFISQSNDEQIDNGSKKFLKYEMKREPGYVFEITMAEARDDENIIVDQIKGARVEVFNNTTREVVMDLEDYQNHEFRVNMQKGNHYTIMIRKKGYLAKRMEAYVNVKGCILCFEGIGDVRPGVTPNLTEGNDNGILLANVELDSVFRGKKFAINDLYYDLGKWDLKPEAEEELQKVITMMKDNPHLSIELGSHTDSRGSAPFNKNLSEKRAQSAVNYLRSRGVISPKRITSKGYGEEEIKNGCTDGVDCPEELHAQNRRTELKIIGIDNDGSIVQSLAEIKREEYMEQLLEEVTSSEQIRVTGEDTLLFDQKTIPEPTTKAKEKVIDDSGLAEITREETKTKTVQDELISINTTEKILVEGSEKNVDEIVVRSDSDFTGYRIVVLESAQSIANDSPLWKKHPQMEVYFNGTVFLYCIGAFEKKVEAEMSIASGIRLEYPQCYVIEVKDGVLVRE